MADKKRKTETNNENNKKMKLAKLVRKDFNVSCYDLANFLLGKVLVRKLDGDTILKGRIVETESYPGGEDKASATHDGRRTAANEPLYMQPGTSFVYMTYGMYHCFNISGAEDGGGVLLRALEPLEGVTEMMDFRLNKLTRSRSKELEQHHLCNGPSKLCISMDIRKDNCNKVDLCDNDALWIETDADYVEPFTIVKTGRIGIKRAGPKWEKEPFRFYILGNPNVSVVNRTAEEELQL